jgi:hypothetical protein
MANSVELPASGNEEFNQSGGSSRPMAGHIFESHRVLTMRLNQRNGMRRKKYLQLERETTRKIRTGR